METKYWRYSATGNTFLMFDAREESYDSLLANQDLMSRLCKEHDVDGMIFLHPSHEYDFHMRYLNADGGEVEMCGNGTRAITHFASQVLGMMASNYQFSTFSGVYESKVEDLFPVRMTEYKEANAIGVSDLFPQALSSYYVNTGVPHCIFEVEDPHDIDLLAVAPSIRRDERFEKGTNVNFYSCSGNHIVMRTFERGVEDETLSCGTGAVAVVRHLVDVKKQVGLFNVKMPGGTLQINFDETTSSTWLAGPVEITQQGTLTF